MEATRKIADIYLEDTGCEDAPKCLECPFVICKFEDFTEFKRLQRVASDKEIYDIIIQSKFTPLQAAKHFNITLRSVYNIQRRVNNQL